MRVLLTLVLMLLAMLASMAMGVSEKWLLLVICASWAPLLTLILVPLLTRSS